MSTVDRSHTLAEVVQRGKEIFECEITPKLLPDDHAKFVAIDILSGEYELDPDDYSAVKKLRTRLPLAEIYLARAGFPATCIMRGIR